MISLDEVVKLLNLRKSERQMYIDSNLLKMFDGERSIKDLVFLISKNQNLKPEKTDWTLIEEVLGKLIQYWDAGIYENFNDFFTDFKTQSIILIKNGEING